MRKRRQTSWLSLPVYCYSFVVDAMFADECFVAVELFSAALADAFVAVALGAIV